MSIPKIIHQIWLGDKKPPIQLCQSWKDMYPDYEYKFWTEDNIPTDLINQKKFDLSQDYCQKTDILRYEILHRFGGFYVDSDTLSIKKIPETFLTEVDLFASYEYGETDFDGKEASDLEGYLVDLVSNAYIAAVPGYELLKFMINTIESMDDEFYLKQKPWISTGPGLFTEILKQYQAAKPDAKIKIHDKQYFNPFRLENPLEKLLDEALKTAYAIHFFSSTYKNYELLDDVVTRVQRFQ